MKLVAIERKNRCYHFWRPFSKWRLNPVWLAQMMQTTFLTSEFSITDIDSFFPDTLQTVFESTQKNDLEMSGKTPNIVVSMNVT